MARTTAKQLEHLTNDDQTWSIDDDTDDDGVTDDGIVFPQTVTDRNENVKNVRQTEVYPCRCHVTWPRPQCMTSPRQTGKCTLPVLSTKRRDATILCKYLQFGINLFTAGNFEVFTKFCHNLGLHTATAHARRQRGECCLGRTMHHPHLAAAQRRGLEFSAMLA